MEELINRTNIFYQNNKLENNRYCISVSKKIGKAVIRNKIKRQLKDILMKNKLCFNKDYVIIIRKRLLELNYQQIETNLINLIKKIGDNNEKK